MHLMDIVGSIEQGGLVKLPDTCQEQNHPLSHVLLKLTLLLSGVSTECALALSQ